MDVLEHRKSKITGAIMANGLADRFKRGDESVMEMMKRIKGEITTDATADQWENKLEEFGVVFSHDEIPEGHFTIESNGCVSIKKYSKTACTNLKVQLRS